MFPFQYIQFPLPTIRMELFVDGRTLFACSYISCIWAYMQYQTIRPRIFDANVKSNSKYLSNVTVLKYMWKLVPNGIVCYVKLLWNLNIENMWALTVFGFFLRFAHILKIRPRGQILSTWTQRFFYFYFIPVHNFTNFEFLLYIFGYVENAYRNSISIKSNQ